MAAIKQLSPRPLLSRRRSLNWAWRGGAIVSACLMLALPGFAQNDTDEDPAKGMIWHGYTVQQSVELGGRVTATNGNQQMYDTLVNLQSGPRLLSQELAMRSMTHTGWFDQLYLSSFGFGGDPNDLARLRIEKNKWYSFVGLYRRDNNFSDDNLLANPLNPIYPLSPLTANPAYVNSPQLQNTTRNMGDFNLTLFPQSAIRIRLGYSRNDNQGDVYSTLHETNEIDLLNDYRSRSDRYQFGVDVRPFARTTISFDQFFVHDKVDNNSNLNPLFGNFFPIGTSTGTLVNIGFPYAPAPYNYPCAITGNPLGGAVSNGVLGTPTSVCNAGAYLYHFSDNVRTTLPTSQLSLRSNYFRKLDITASGTYSGGSSDVYNIDDLFRGVVSRSGNVVYDNPGSAGIERVSTSADLGLTYRFSRAWSVSSQFRWLNWRDSGALNQSLADCYSGAATSNVNSPIGNNPLCSISAALFPGVPFTPAGNQTSSSYPEVLTSNVPNLSFLGERTYINTSRLNWTPGRKLSAYVGFRYDRREIDDKGGPTTGAGSTVSLVSAGTSSSVFSPAAGFASGDQTIKINESTALGGVVVRPIDRWRLNADVELLSADNAFTNISPRNQQRYRFGTTYRLRRWISLSSTVHIVETRNSFGPEANLGNTGTGATAPNSNNLFQGTATPAYGHKDHYRYYTVSVSLDPSPRLGFDAGWTYLDQQINSATCMPVSASGTSALVLPNGTIPSVPSTAQPWNCVSGFGSAAAITAGYLPVVLAYGEDTNTGYFNLRVKPIKRVTLSVGYELTSSSGYNNWLRADPGAPGQPLLVGVNSVNGTAQLTNSPGAIGGIALGPYPLAPLGPLDTNWHKPYAGLTVDIARGVAFKGVWSYYDYNEKDVQNAYVLLPRSFHTNVGTLSLKYSF